MSRLKRKNKLSTFSSVHNDPPSLPPQSHRVGDLLWCRENKKRYTIWWPAMVTYEPNQAIISRTTTRGIPQVHVQYFGISAVRGWVSQLQYEPLVEVASRSVPVANLGKKLKCEFEVALQEAMEALRMTHKERKLKFIFNFDPPGPRSSSQESLKPRIKTEEDNHTLLAEQRMRGVKQEMSVGDGSTVRPLSKQKDEAKKLLRRRSGRINSINCPPLSQCRTRNKTLSPRGPSRQSLQGSSDGVCEVKESVGSEDFVVSLNINGLGTPSGNRPTLLVGESPVKMNSFAVPVDTMLNLAGNGDYLTNHPPPNGLVEVPRLGRRGRGRPRRVSSTSSQNFRRAPILGNKKKSTVKLRCRARSEQPSVACPPPVKRLAMDPGSESGSEMSGVSIASAILMTPPSSGTEAMMEDEERRERGNTHTISDGLMSDIHIRQENISSDVTPSVHAAVSMKDHTRTDPPPANMTQTFRDGECAICDARDTDLLVCQGHCFQAFHIDCLGLVHAPNFQFVCDECQTVTRQCYVCSGSYGPLERCAKPKCSKFYHRSCINDNTMFTFDILKAKFTCPLHSCAKCVCSELDAADNAPRGCTLVQCVKCPLALHKPHCLIAGCNLISASHMICYLHISIGSELNLYKHLNMDTCLECGKSGSLYCCDFCSSAYHEECMEEHHKPVKMMDSEKWICPACRDHDLPTYESVVLCKFGRWRWWPGQVVPMSDIPDNIKKKQPGEGMFVVRFCGTRDYCWIHHGRTLSISLEPGADPAKEVNKMCRSHGKRGANTDRIFKKACEEAMELYLKQVKLQEERKPLPKQESKAYTKIKVNKYLVPRPTISDDDLHSLPCQCTPDSPCDDDSICVNRAIHVECNPKTCPVGPFCHNQKMRRFQHANTVPFYAGNRGWGLRAASDIDEGDFVVEYVGEVLDMKMCHERLQRAHETRTQHFYMLTLDSKNGLVIDAKEKSNHARFINHSCDPNCETQKWTVGHESRVGIFAKKFIKSGAELTFDYQLDSLGNGKKECLCGSSNCSGFLGVRSKVEHKPKPKPKLKKKANPQKLIRPRLPQIDMPPVEVTHENECFLCGDGGDLLCCDFGKCRKVYHLHCLGRKMIPPEKWVCPRHYCTMCSKRAFVFCDMCPTSYCGKHRRDKLVEVNGQQICDSCANNSSSSSSTSPCVETTQGEVSTRISIPINATRHNNSPIIKPIDHSPAKSVQRSPTLPSTVTPAGHSPAFSAHTPSKPLGNSPVSHSPNKLSGYNPAVSFGNSPVSYSPNKLSGYNPAVSFGNSPVSYSPNKPSGHSPAEQFGSSPVTQSTNRLVGHSPVYPSALSSNIPSSSPPIITSLHTGIPSLPTALPSLTNLHHLPSVPFLSHHSLGRHPLHPLTHHQPLQLVMPSSNHHLFYFNSPQPFLSSPSSTPLVYSPTYHHQ